MNVELVISIIALLVSLVTAIYGIWHSQRVEKKKATIEAYNDLQQFLYFLYEYGKDEMEDFVTDKNSQEYKVISSCIARIELFATGINQNIYDYKIAYSMAHGYLDITLRDKIEYILESKNGKNKEAFYKNTRILLEKMDRTSLRSSVRK